MSKLLEDLQKGKKIKVKHPEYAFTIHAELKMEEESLAINIEKVNLPQKASKAEKLLLKYVNIYCFDTFRTNLLNDVISSMEYNKVLNQLRKERTPWLTVSQGV